MSHEIQIKQFDENIDKIDIDYVDTEMPKLSDEDHVLIKMKVCSINPFDIQLLKGNSLLLKPKNFPLVPGIEGYGIVEEVGKNVKNFNKGDKVVPCYASLIVEEDNKGVWRDYLVIHEDKLIKIPSDIDDNIASQFFINPFSAYAILKLLNVPKGKCLLQSGAETTFGKEVISLAHHMGIKTINLIRNKDEEQKLKDLGGDHILYIESVQVERFEHLHKEIVDITEGEGPYAGIDSVGGDMGILMTECIRNKGTIISNGYLSGQEILRVHAPCMLFREIEVKGFFINNYIKSLNHEEFIKMVNELIKLLEDKVIKAESQEIIEAKDIKTALKKYCEPSTHGKILLGF